MRNRRQFEFTNTENQVMETADVKRLAKVYKWVASIAVASISSLSSGMCLMWTFLWEASLRKRCLVLCWDPLLHALLEIRLFQICPVSTFSSTVFD